MSWVSMATRSRSSRSRRAPRGEFGLAVSAVPPAKQRRIARAAPLYLTRHPYSGPCRFDVLAMDMEEAGWSFDWVRNAFDVG